VKYVILVHEADYKHYDFLYHQKDLKVELEKPGITLFRNEHPTAKVYAVDSVVHISSLDDYLELGKKHDVMEHLYVLGSTSEKDQNSFAPGLLPPKEIEELNHIRKSPVRYEVEGTCRRYTIFTVPQNVSTEHWQYNGQQPVAKNLGLMPAFSSRPTDGEITYKRFYYVYLPAYVISGLTLGWMAYYYCLARRKRQHGAMAR